MVLFWQNSWSHSSYSSALSLQKFFSSNQLRNAETVGNDISIPFAIASSFSPGITRPGRELLPGYNEILVVNYALTHFEYVAVIMGKGDFETLFNEVSDQHI